MYKSLLCIARSAVHHTNCFLALFIESITLCNTCNTLQRTATHCNPLQHTPTHFNTLHHKTGAREYFWRLHHSKISSSRGPRASSSDTSTVSTIPTAGGYIIHMYMYIAIYMYICMYMHTHQRCLQSQLQVDI